MNDRTRFPGAILFAVCLAAVAMPLSFTGPAVALPAIARSLGGNAVALNWVTNAFMLSFGGTLMAAGALADAYGRRRVFLAGTAGFAVASAALAAAPGLIWVDLLRAAQGMAAAASLAGGMAALAQAFDGPGRLRAFSLVGASFGIGLAFGPVAAGLMVDAFGWRAIFGLAVILTAGACGLAARVLPESRDPDAAGLDWPGAASFTLALTLLTGALLEVPAAGWGAPPVIAMLAGAAGLAAAFVTIERRVARPMLELSLFRYPRFVGVQLLAAAPAYGFVVLLVLLPVRFVGIEGMSAAAAGRAMIALSAPLVILPVAAGVLARRIAPSAICGGGLLVAAAGLLWLAAAPPGPPGLGTLAPMLLIGVGISLPWGLMDGLAVSVVPPERAGMAAGIFNTTRVAGEGVALALVGAALSILIATQLAAHGAGAPVQAAVAAQLLAVGDPAGAALSLPALDRAALVHGYEHAFAMLLRLLACVTTLTAFVVFRFLGREAGHAEAVDEAA